MKKAKSSFINMFLTLLVVCALAGAALAAVYQATSAPIQQARDNKQEEAIKQVLPPFDELKTEKKALETISSQSLFHKEAGADALSLINTVLALRIDLKTRRPVLANVTGGLSGPAVFPLALRMVWQVSQAVKIPVIGLGGVSSAEDAAEMMLAGAAAVQIGAANLKDPFACPNILRALPRVLDRLGVEQIRDIIGGAHG